MKVSNISLGLFNHTGGPTKTVGDFKCALNSELYAFCEQRILKKHELAVGRANPVISSPVPILSQFCYARKAAKKAEAAVRESSLVVCHGFYRYHALWTHKVCKTAGVPYWFVPHGILDPWVMQKNRWIKQLYWKFGGRQFLQDASTVIFSASAERDKAASQFDLPGAEVIPWPVELVDLTIREEAREQIRSQLGIPQDARVLLYFGRLNLMKRPLEIVEAFAKANGVDAHLIIVGNESGITKAACMQAARKHGIEKKVHCVGAVYGEAKYHYLHASDAYISFSYRENFNHTAAESLAAGLPVILSPGNDLRSELSGVGCCLNIEDDSLQSAVKVIEEFNDMDLLTLHEMGVFGRKWVESNLSFDLFKERIIELHKNHAKTESDFI